MTSLLPLTDHIGTGEEITSVHTKSIFYTADTTSVGKGLPLAGRKI